MKKLLLSLSLFTFLVASGQNMDIDLLRSINVGRNKGLDGTFQFITSTMIPISVGTPIVIYGYGLLQKRNQHFKSDALMIGASLVVSTGLTLALKYSVKRQRPYKTYHDLDNLDNDLDPYSFPSGHTSAAFSTATSLSMAFPRWYVIAPSYTWASLVGYSRLHIGVHYPSDVLIGALIGAGSAYLCFKGREWLNKR